MSPQENSALMPPQLLCSDPQGCSVPDFPRDLRKPRVLRKPRMEACRCSSRVSEVTAGSPLPFLLAGGGGGPGPLSGTLSASSVPGAALCLLCVRPEPRSGHTSAIFCGNLSCAASSRPGPGTCSFCFCSEPAFSLAGLSRGQGSSR